MEVDGGRGTSVIVPTVNKEINEMEAHTHTHRVVRVLSHWRGFMERRRRPVPVPPNVAYCP